MPAISILIPCYNAATTVDEALSSLAGQTLTDFEVLLVDDGSTDGTLDRLQDWSRRDPRFRVFSRPHAGIISALNAGLESCRSDFIARMDADDRSAPHRLRRQVDLLNEHPEIVVISSLVKGFPEDALGIEFRAYIDWLNTLLTDEDIKRGIFLQSPLAHPSVAYQRLWVEQVGGYQDRGWAEDYDLWLRLYLAGANFGKVPEVLLEWRDHPRRLIHTDGRYSKHSDLCLKAYYLAHGPLSSSREVIIWGTGADAYQLSAQLHSLGCMVSAYVVSQRDRLSRPDQTAPILSPVEVLERLRSEKRPIVLVVENDPLRRALIAQQLETLRLYQGIDWWLVG